MENNRIKLKNYRKSKFKIYTYILIIILIITSSIFLIKKIGKNINSKILEISEVEANRISKKIIENSVNETILEYIDNINIFKIERDDKNNIRIIDLDTKEINKLLILVNKNLNKYLKELEEGKSSIIDINKNIVTNTKIKSNKEGIIFEIPIGVVTNNAFLNNLGPKIPIRISLTSEITSKVETKLENYGINSSMLKIFINVDGTEQIILPLTTKRVNINSTILIATKMINGEIPNYYLNNTN